MMQTMTKSVWSVDQRKQREGYTYSGSAERTVQVVIVEAHLLMREALRRVAENFAQVSICASLSKIQDVLTILRKVRVDVLLLGSSITASDCLECVNVVRNCSHVPGIVVIQQRLHAETVFPIIRSGVQGLLGEDASERDLERAIEAAASGNTFLGQRAREILDNSVSRISFHFTEREVQVLSLLRSGSSNFHIAQNLGLKEKTVEKHLTHIYEKLHIRSRTEAVLCVQTLCI